MRRSLTILAAAGALALAAVAAPTASYARYGYWGHHHHRHYGWRAFHGSACDFRNFGPDRQLAGTC